MLNYNLVGLPRLIIYSYLTPHKLLTDIRSLSKKDQNHIATSHIIRQHKHLPFKANLAAVEQHVFSKRRPVEITDRDSVHLLVDLSGPMVTSRMSSYFKMFYKPKPKVDLLDKLD